MTKRITKEMLDAAKMPDTPTARKVLAKMLDDDDIQEYSRPCTNCEYHRQQAQHWREEAYRQAGHPLPERGWVGLTEEEIKAFDTWHDNREEEIGWVNPSEIVAYIEAKLKEKNT